MRKQVLFVIGVFFSFLTITQNASKILTNTPSSLLNKGQFEIQSYQNLYTQVDYRNGQGNYQSGNQRTSYFTSLNYFLIGINENKRVNLGLDLSFRTVFADTEINSPLNTFRFNGENRQRSGITSIGPKIKFLPFKNLKQLSVQSAIWIPIMDSLETKIDKPWLDWDRYTSWTQLFYDIKTDKFQYFFEADLLARFGRKDSDHGIQINTPLSFFLSYIPNGKLIFYGMTQYTPTVTQENTYFIQSGIGSKLQVNNHFNLEFMFSDFIASGNWGGAGQTFNIGLRWIK